MKALTINETLHKVLLPKPKEEVKNILLNTKIPSFQLNLFFDLIEKQKGDLLKIICNRINVDPKDMRIFKPPDFIKTALNNAFELTDDNGYDEITYRGDYGDMVTIQFEYSYKLKLIMFGSYKDRYAYNYYAFYKGSLPSIISNYL